MDIFSDSECYILQIFGKCFFFILKFGVGEGPNSVRSFERASAELCIHFYYF